MDSRSGPGEASVMIVDDNEDLVDTLATVLSRRGYSVRTASGALDALSALEAKSSDVILLDLRMPGMSGWDFRVEQRHRPRLASIPVVAMSSDNSAQAKAIDADAYLAKPFDPQRVIATIERVLVSAERKTLRAQMAESERLRSLGLLASGIAHEINNPLAVVLGCTELSQAELTKLLAHVTEGGTSTLAALRSHLDEIARHAERVAGVVRGIATLGKADVRVSEVDVHEAVNTSLSLIANEIRQRAQLVLDLKPVPRVRANLSQLVQVLLNLLTNAAHAISEGSAAENEVRVSTAVRTRGYVSIEISDTGCGIDSELKSRIFEPFFTTKAIGSGMGLGLAISHRVITELGGTLGVESEVGKGSSFRIDLPVHVEPAVSSQAVSPEQNPGAGPARPRLLIIDDEAAMLDVLAILLSEAYDVTIESNSVSALARLLEGEPPFDLVLCDLMMPNLTGMDLYAEVLKKRPELAGRMLFMTGGTFTERANDFLSSLPRPPLLKPFHAAELMRRLDELQRETH